MVCEDTLRIKNLPMDLSDLEKEDLLRHFGAQKVKIVSFANKQKCIAFAQFESKELAKSILLRLHQIKILNSRLCVEYAEHDIIQDKPKIKKIEPVRCDKGNLKKFISKLNAFNSSVSFYQPPPSHLRYAYPKPNRATINNIAHALASVPKFYTQVLHLMNRMNLPPPFSDIPDPPQVSLRQIQQPIMKQTISDVKEKSSSESEIESDPDSVGQMREIIPMKRNLPQKKGVKRPKFIKPHPINPSSSKSIDKIGEFFEKTEIQKHKIELKVTTNTLKENTGEYVESNSQKNIEPLEESSENTDKGVITEEELRNNRIPSKDLSVLPVFKDYHPGAPTSRLYIKNISKTVEVKDLEYIYRRYIKSNNNSESIFNIRLMQEGRMKGQAFITLDSVELAQEALKETNGYILRDRPLVVVFAKSAAQKK